MAAEFATKSKAVTFMVSGGLVFEIIAGMCSSPQTAEINAGKRAETLMKWVIIGLVTAALFVAIAVYLDEDRWPSILGGGLAGAILWAAYAHAKDSGLKSELPGTEDTESESCPVTILTDFLPGQYLPSWDFAV